LLEHAKVSFARVNHIRDLFPNQKEYPSPLSLEIFKNSGEDKYYIPDLSFVDDGTFVL
jgi:hypothetical protein